MKKRSELESSQIAAQQKAEWPLDAENKVLSYTKMEYERNRKQVRRIKEQKNSKKDVFVHFPICGNGSHSGWFCPCRKAMKSDLAERLGIGMVLYFKTLKQLIIFLILCTILSIPSFVFFWSGRQGSTVFRDSKVFFSTFTLGNLGQSSDACSTVDFTTLLTQNKTSVEVELFCPYGVFDDINVI